ncbi:MAG TPA: RidA family protein [Alphaproteobacteria bacterium]|nr:RidA family protein [Alphaproteobacteria bacterium]
MLKHINPPTIARPASRYSHAVEAPPQARWLYISGQVGVTPEGKALDGFEAQADQAWRNLRAALQAADMDLGDLVRINYYLTDAAHIAAARAVRERYVKEPAPASTMVIVQALASPAWLFEVEGVAAKA